MTYQSKMEEFLRSIGYDGEKTVREASANTWSRRWREEFFKPEIEKILDKNLVYTEKKEEEIKTTTEELITNSCTSCDEREDLQVELNIYYGEKGVLTEVVDQGSGFDYEEVIQNAYERHEKLEDLSDQEILGGVKEFEGGTGFECLFNFADEFKYSEKGDKVVVKYMLEEI